MAEPDAVVNERRTWSLEEFQGGIDLRDGLFSANQTRFRELKNLFVDKGRKLRRRPPCLRVDGELSANCQGLVSIDGQLYTFAKEGDSVAHTGGVHGLVQTLRFTNPDHCTSWELITAGVFDGYAVAWIKHTYPSYAYPSVTMLHVWDGLIYAPTFVQDPYLPGSFSPSIADLADQRYDAAFRPVLGQGVTKLWSSTLRGNAHCCRTADARIWNQRTKDSLLEDGEHWCFIVPEGIQVRDFIVPRNADWLTGEGSWAYYVCERNVGDGWEPMEEVSGTPTASYTWQASSVASRFAGGWNEIKVSVKWGSASGAGLIRLRLVAGATSLDVTQTPTVEAVAGTGGGSWKLKVGEAKFRYRGGDSETDAQYETADLVGNKVYLLSVSDDDATFPRLLNLTDDGFPNGWGREHRCFIKKITTTEEAEGRTEWEGSWTPAWVTMTGKVDISGTSLTGNVPPDDTLFTSELTIISGYGDRVRVGGDVRQIATITDDVTATVTSAWSGPLTVQTIEKGYSYARYDSGKTQVRVDATLAAQLSVGNTLRINSVLYKVSEVSGQLITITNLAGANGDYTADAGKLQTIYKTSTPTIEDYQYAFQANTDSAWYTDRVVEYVDQAGAEDALSISTAAHDNTGGQITSITAVRQRMLITYPGSMQLWAIDQDTNRTAYLDQLSFGTGGQATPQPVPWYGSVITPVETGYRAISVVGSNTDNLQDLNVGEPIAALPELSARAAQFWPWYGQTIIAGATDNGLEFRCLDYSRESKITAWSQWTVSGLNDVDTGTLIATQDRLWFRSGSRLHYFDAKATTFRDFADAEGSAYESAAFFHFNDMGRPGQNKRILALDLVQDGTCTMAFRLPPYGASFAAETAGPDLAGPTVEGITYGRTRLPLAMVATAIAPRISTRDETGWRLQRLALDFLLLRR